MKIILLENNQFLFWSYELMFKWTKYRVVNADLCYFFLQFLVDIFPLDLDPWIRIFLRIRIQEAKILRLQRAGEGRRPWATTISPSVPHSSFFLFRQP